MNSLSEIYFTTERYLFPMVEEEIGEISEKMKEFLRIVETIRPAASLHDSQVAIPLMQKVAERATVLYDLADSGYDAGEIRDFSSQLGHVPIIDCNKRRGEYIPFAPAEQRRYCERSTVERGNSDLKDNYGARHVRVKGHWKVWCHLMFGVIAIAVKQLYNMIV